MEKKIVWLASHNKTKYNDLKILFNKNTHLDLRTPDELGIKLDVPEPHNSYILNARDKLIAYQNAIARKLGEKPWVISDDSGLEIEGIANLPGLITARFIPPELAKMCKDGTIPRDRVERMRQDLLLWFMERTKAFNPGKPQSRKCKYVCALLWNIQTPTYSHAIGELNGWIVDTIDQARGSNGVTFDPLFRFSRSDKRTLAELNTVEKDSISHRGRAFAMMINQLKDAIPEYLNLS